MNVPKFLLLVLGFTSLAACANEPTPVAIQRCEVSDGNVYPGNRPSYVHLALVNQSDQKIRSIVVFVTYTANGYGFPIEIRQNIEPRETLRLVHKLSEDENLSMIAGKWEYSCWLESATLANGSIWSGAVQRHWPRI